MTTLAEQFDDDVSSVFLNADEHAESITYASAEITAVVERGVTEDRYIDDGRVTISVARVWVALADVSSPAEGDLLSFAKIPGGTATTWVVTRIESADGGMAAVVCQEQSRDLHRVRPEQHDTAAQGRLR